MRLFKRREPFIEILETRRLLSVTADLLKDVNTTSEMLGAQSLTTAGNVGYFLGHNSVGDGGELFRTDGTRRFRLRQRRRRHGK